jgi:hypothetical protein
MQQRFPQKLLISIFGFFLALGLWFVSPIALAYNNPDLLPETQTPVIDLAKYFTSSQKETLTKDLETFETETGWKLRVLTQFDRTPGLALKEYWQLDDRSLLVVADSRGGNILNFNVGDGIYKLMPRTFWIELQTRYGNLYYVREHGEDEAVIDSLESVKTCLRQGGCQVVPGLPKEQWILTLATSMLGGIICGFAAQPRKSGQVFSWQWALIFSPLWGILFVAFGLGPVVTRTSEWLPVFRNVAGFFIGVLVAYLTPIFNRSSASES